MLLTALYLHYDCMCNILLCPLQLVCTLVVVFCYGVVFLLCNQTDEEDFIADLFTSNVEEHEVVRYLACSDTVTGTDLLEYWHQKANVWPRLTSVALYFLAVPATSTPSERAFSLAGRTLEERRTQLCADSVDSLLFLHSIKL